MPEPTKLTQTTLKTLSCPPGKKDVLVFDSETSGFAVRVTAQGSKIFLAQYRGPLGVRRVTIGKWGVLTAEQARKAAQDVLAKATQGRDPVAEQQAQEQAARDEQVAQQAEAEEAKFTFGKMVDAWAAAHEGMRAPAYLSVATGALKGNFSDWSDRPAKSITRKEALAELARIKANVGGTAANRGLAYARSVFNWAIHQELVSFNPMLVIKPLAKEVSRDRVLTMGELAILWRAFDLLPSPYTNYMRMLVLTLQRRQEVAGMRWSEISDDGFTWTVPGPRAKNRKAHIVHLSRPARDILASVPREEGQPFVFPSDQGKSVTAYSYIKELLDQHFAVLREAKAIAEHYLVDWRFHDFRRTAVTVLVDHKVDPHVCDRLLNHITGTLKGTTLVYQRAEFLSERETAGKLWADLIMKEIQPTPPRLRAVA